MYSIFWILGIFPDGFFYVCLSTTNSKRHAVLKIRNIPYLMTLYIYIIYIYIIYNIYIAYASPSWRQSSIIINLHIHIHAPTIRIKHTIATMAFSIINSILKCSLLTMAFFASVSPLFPLAGTYKQYLKVRLTDLFHDRYHSHFRGCLLQTQTKW